MYALAFIGGVHAPSSPLVAHYVADGDGVWGFVK
jgi:hypothetical protein